MYTFENICHEDKDLLLKDEEYKVFYNASACDKIKSDKRLKELLVYLRDGIPTGNFTSDIEQMVESGRHNQQWRQNFMTLERMLNERYDKGHAEGVAEGREEGKIEGLKNAALKLLNKKISIEQISDFLDIPLEQLKDIMEK